MRISHLARLATAVLMLVTPLAAHGQQTPAPKLEIGTWTGVVITPNGEINNVTYDVAVKNDTLTIMINAGEHGSFSASNIKVDVGKLNFSFTPGPTVACALTRKPDLSYEGTCTDDGGSPAQMTMIPPKKTTPGS